MVAAWIFLVVSMAGRGEWRRVLSNVLDVVNGRGAGIFEGEKLDEGCRGVKCC